MRGAYGWGWWDVDPGPCPVDDTPHTGCTPDSVAVPLQQSLQRDQTCRVVIQPPAVFSTAGYRRALHAPGARRVPTEPVRVTPATPTPTAAAPTPTRVAKGRRR
jgi:hypothetical protein